MKFDYQVVNEMASAAGLSCIVDPVLVTALKVQRTGIEFDDSCPIFELINPIISLFLIYTETNEDEHLVACLLLVFIAVALPRLARSESSMYR